MKRNLMPFLVVILFLLFVLKGERYRARMNTSQGTTFDSIYDTTFLVANVGNLNLGCRKYLNNLCYKEVESRVGAQLKKIRPDLIALQEVLAPWQCMLLREKDSSKSCFDKQDEAQIRRLIGDGYTISCDTVNEFECIGVNVDYGAIEGCPIGDLCNTARTIMLPTYCDPGFTVSAVTINPNMGPQYDLVNVHLQSTSSYCRSEALRRAFGIEDDGNSLIETKAVVIMGDFNFDPWRDDDVSVRLWNKILRTGWGGSEFRYLSGIIEDSGPFYTSYIPFRLRTLDFVVSNSAEGTSVTLGETPGTERLDGGSGMDHRAIYGGMNAIPDWEQGNVR